MKSPQTRLAIALAILVQTGIAAGQSSRFSSPMRPIQSSCRCIAHGRVDAVDG